MSLAPKKRFEILRRDNFACVYCGAASPNVELHVDHVHPKSKGGSDHPANLVTACWECNIGKGAQWAFVRDDFEPWYLSALSEHYRDEAQQLWPIIRELEDEGLQPEPPTDWEGHVGFLVESGLTIEPMADLLRFTCTNATSTTKSPWRDFLRLSRAFLWISDGQEQAQ